MIGMTEALARETTTWPPRDPEVEQRRLIAIRIIEEVKSRQDDVRARWRHFCSSACKDMLDAEIFNETSLKQRLVTLQSKLKEGSDCMVPTTIQARQIETYQRALARARYNIRKVREALNGAKNGINFDPDEVDALLKTKGVLAVDMVRNQLLVYTDMVYIHDRDSLRWFEIGMFAVLFALQDSKDLPSIKNFCSTHSSGKHHLYAYPDGIATDRDGFQYFCFGNANERIRTLSLQKRFAAVFDVVLACLRSANGAHRSSVCDWREVSSCIVFEQERGTIS